MMNRYEMIYIIDTGLEEAARKELIEKVSALIEKNGGEIEKVDETWGKRRLAYAIDYKTEGWYVLVTFKAPAELPRELERNLQINENVLRYLVVKLVEKRSSVKPRANRPAPVEAPAEAEAAPAAEAPVAEAAEEAAPATEEAPAAEAAPADAE
jgi:small subunit ribosomal protein S6